MHMQTFGIVTRIKNMNPIQISIWNGVVMGGGAGMSINSKIRIATESTVFAMPEASVGYIPDFALTVYFARLRSNIGLYLALTGAKVTGRQVYSVGLADYFVPQKSLESLEKEYAEVIDEKITLEKLHEVTKKLSDPQKDLKFDHEEVIEVAFGQKTLKDVFRKLEELSAGDAFAKKTLDILKRSPPRSLRIVFEQYKRAKNLDVNQGLDMDYRLTRIMHENDFVEGTGWKFLKNTKEPKWIDSSIDIPDEIINRYFEPITDEFRKIDFAKFK